MAVESESGLVILGVLGLFGNTIAVVIGAWLAARNSRRAQEDASKAQIATAMAAQTLEEAKKAAANGARELVIEARRTNSKLVNVGEVVEESRAELLRIVMLLTERIAKEHPEDDEAQSSARSARAGYEKVIRQR